MKTTISCFILLLFFTGINAQEIKITNPETTTNEVAILSNDKPAVLNTEQTADDYTCYSEISKITFYEALIKQNGLEISLDNQTIDLKTTNNISNL